MEVPMTDDLPASGLPINSAPFSRREFLRYSTIAAAMATAGTLLPFGQSPALAAASSFAPLRPPATPLAVRSMYLSTWLAGDNLPGTWPTFWNGHVTAMTGIVRVDNVPYVFCGAPGGGYALAAQQSLTVTSTTSTFVIKAGGVNLTITFFSPVDPLNLRRQSIPMSYVTVSAAANDGGSHPVSLYMDVSGEWAHGDVGHGVTWAQQVLSGMQALTIQPASPGVLSEFGDQASWGTVIWATDNVSGVTWQTGADTVVRANGAAGSLPNTNDTVQPRAINDNWPVLGLNRNLGTVTSAGSAQTVFVIGHARTPAVSYLGANLNPWWTTYFSTWQAMLPWFRADLPLALAVCGVTDRSINAWASQAVGGGTVGAQYAAICALALRQAFAGTELVNHNGTPWAFLKEISSSGNVSTIDVTYPGFPAWLQLSPSYTQLLLAPIFDYVETHSYPHSFAPHDLGSSYPNATGHLSGSGEEDMPVEETANMLIMAASLIARLPAGQAASYAQQHYPILHQWGDYLVANALDPGNQNQTDDFTGFIAHSVNLALKGIVGIGAMAEIAATAGNTGDKAYYAGKARSYIASWQSMGQSADKSHMRQTYDGSDSTWSLKYNGFPDRLLNTNLVPPVVQNAESGWYLNNQHTYGVILDPRNQYTKTDWELWTAAFLSGHPTTRNMFIGKVYSFANTSTSRAPFTDWYDTNSGNQVGFAARPVIGGLLALMTLRWTPNGMTGYWPFDNARTYDDSGNLGDGILNGGASFGTGKQGGAVSLNGATGCVSTPRPVVRTDTSFTVVAWVNLANTATFHTAVSQDGDRVSGFFLQYSASEDRWALTMTNADVDNAASVRALSTAPPATGVWTHLAGVHDSTAGQIKLYVNGALQQTTAKGSPWTANGNLQIGRGKWNGNSTDFFPGLIDEVRTFDHALTDAEIASSFHLGDGLVASYGFDDAGGTANDTVGGHTLTLAAAASFGAGYSGGGLALAAGSGSATTSAALVNTSASFSVAAWVNIADLTGFHSIASQDGVQASGFYLQYSGADNAWAFAMTSADVANPSSTRALSLFAPKVNDWTHLVGVHDAAAGLLKIYVNGVLGGTAAHTGAWNATGVFAVGRARYNGGPVDYLPGGALDQVRVWNRALSDADVRALV
jgi:hypothetical protein